MITAIEAAEVSNKVAADHEVIRWVHDVADKRVREEAARGERGVWVDGPPTELSVEPAIEYLRALGYKAWRGKDGRRDQIVISWRHLS